MAEPASLRELPPLAQVALRGRTDDAAFVAAAAATLGFALPAAPNTVARQGGLAALWLGPDEWLVTGGGGGLPALLRDALAGTDAAAVDVSASRVVFELAGAAARGVLAKGCGLDFHPRAFGPDRCAQTLLARAAVIVEQVDAAPRFRIFVRRSYARYLAAWLADAAGGSAPATP